MLAVTVLQLFCLFTELFEDFCNEYYTSCSLAVANMGKTYYTHYRQIADHLVDVEFSPQKTSDYHFGPTNAHG